ncbi:MAG: site-2 protease family protein [Oscillospiraceae bacterium]|nr:site-2 protease family protein [Oscillospiraceae bacterium]
MQIVVAILVFCVIIIIHELGHFFAAKACGIYVKEFALGMGPVIFRKKGKETEYVIRLLPIGGSCSMEGKDGFDETRQYAEDLLPGETTVFPDDDKQPTPKNPRAFNAKPVWQRMIVILAGPVMNLVLGFFVVLISLCCADVIGSTVISTFRDQSVSSSRLMVDDEIISIDGTHIFCVSDIVYKLQSSDRINADGNLVFDITVKRGGEKLVLKDVEFMTKSGENGNSIYFDFMVYRQDKNFLTVINESFRESCSTARLIIMTLVDMLRGKYGLNDFSGPVGTISAIGEVASSPDYSISDFLSVVSLITINVGIFNLIPIPALDGCRILFLLIEAIRRKPVKPQVEGMVHFAGFALLMLFMLVVTFNDILRLVSGGQS